MTFTQAVLDEVRRVYKDKLDHLTEPKGFADLSDRVRKLEDYSRKNNVIIEGLPESKNETTDKIQSTLSHLLKDKMNIVPDIDAVHRMGKLPPTRDKLRPVIMKLKSSNNRQDCLKYASRLKGSNVYINKDVSKETMEIRKTKMEDLN